MAKFSKKHYIKIANIFNTMRMKAYWTHGQRVAIEKLAREFAYEFSIDNHAFDEHRFLKECGVPLV